VIRFIDARGVERVGAVVSVRQDRGCLWASATAQSFTMCVPLDRVLLVRPPAKENRDRPNRTTREEIVAERLKQRHSR